MSPSPSPRPPQRPWHYSSDAPDIQEPQSPAVAVIGSRNETELERHDRNLNELLGELRVALPGVQVLFAFLLVAPFNQRFGTLSHFERRLYFVTLLCTLLASILLIAPTLVHRFQFRLGEKAYVVDTANRPMIAGLSVFAVAMTCAVLLITPLLVRPGYRGRNDRDRAYHLWARLVRAASREAAGAPWVLAPPTRI